MAAGSGPPTPVRQRFAPYMDLAARTAEKQWGTTRPNPTVGAVVLDAAGSVVATGATEPAGGRHAEVVALDAAGDRARGGTIVVTLEPCNHTGRTGPCTQRILDEGLAEVVYAVSDPNPVASGGADRLAAAGLDVHADVGMTAEGVGADVLRGPLGSWYHLARTGRPQVTWKYAASLDGRSAAADGTSQWITGPEARAHTLARRSLHDAIVVGTGTAIADDPSLTARDREGRPLGQQPLRCVMGESLVPPEARVRGGDGRFLQLRTRDPLTAIRSIASAAGPGTESVLLEGGPHLAGAFLQAGIVDRIEAYIAPAILGEGMSALVGAGVQTIAQAHRFTIETVEMIGSDLCAVLIPDPRYPIDQGQG